MGLCGAILVLPYLAALENKALAAAAARKHFEIWELLTISVAQVAVFLSIAVLAGLWAARKLGLGTPFIAAVLSRKPAPEKMRSSLAVAVAVGIATGFVLVVLDRWVFAFIPSVAALTRSMHSAGNQPEAWQGLLASFYGAFDEEILMRLGLLSLLALAFRTLARMLGANRENLLPANVFWAANIVTAVLFGLGHLPATAALTPLTTSLIVRAIVLNGAAGLVFGALYRRYGLESAMTSHFAADIVLHVGFG